MVRILLLMTASVYKLQEIGYFMKTIVVIGAGQLGSRHLQALSKVNFKTTIEVVDPFESSLVVAKGRFNENHPILTFPGLVSFQPCLKFLAKLIWQSSRLMQISELKLFGSS